MSEKRGKGFLLPTKTIPKSFFKSTPTSSTDRHGKDDNSAKPKKGRKVQFGTKGSPDLKFNFSPPKFNGKFATPIGKKLPKNVKCLMDCEAASVLESIQEQMVILSEDSTSKLLESFDFGMRYAKTGSYYTNPQFVRQVLGILSKYGVSYSEICVIANSSPETVDEVFALVRSLEAKRSRLSDPLKDVLDKLAKLKKSMPCVDAVVRRLLMGFYYSMF
ncbi:hypothetical protein CRYUN_Cryun34aG0001100 [Craigia yunnanensis]